MAEGPAWAPSRKVFLKRSMMAGAATFVALMATGWIISAALDLPLFWTLPGAAMLTAGFFVDDALRWRSHKYDRWWVEGPALMHRDQDGILPLPLAEVEEVRTRLGNRVVLGLRSGRRLTLRYLPYPEQCADQIRALLPGTD
jgi:hypothetical protein